MDAMDFAGTGSLLFFYWQTHLQCLYKWIDFLTSYIKHVSYWLLFLLGNLLEGIVVFHLFLIICSQ